jgi:hypothetical protein
MIKKREAFDKLLKYIDLPESIVIHGARQVGKTTLMKMLVDYLKNNSNHNIFFFDLERIEYLNLCNKGINDIVSYMKAKSGDIAGGKKTYLFIDEIQYLDNPSSLLKLFYDEYKDSVKLIVSGSSSFAMKHKFKNSLVGRILDVELFGLSFTEFLDFKGQEFNLNERNDLADYEITKYYKEYCIYGYYPQVVLAEYAEQKEIYLNGIVDKYIYKDIRDIANVRNITKFNQLLTYLASQVCGLVNLNEISNTLKISRQTIEDYLFILENTYIIKLLKPFFGNVRSELSKMPKVFFEDNGILNLLRNKKLLDKPDGELFENSIYTTLRRIYSPDDISFWRTASKQEVDFIISGESISAREVKLGEQFKVHSGLKSFKSKYETADTGIITLTKNKSVSEKQYYPWEL